MARRRPPAALPAASPRDLAIREQLFAQIGFDTAEQARLARCVVLKLQEGLTRKMVTRLVVGDGKGYGKVEEFIDDDSAHQLRASALLIELLGLNAPKKQVDSHQGPQIVQVQLMPLPPSGPTTGPADRPQLVKAVVRPVDHPHE